MITGLGLKKFNPKLKIKNSKKGFKIVAVGDYII
jgi:hypothetical protein